MSAQASFDASGRLDLGLTDMSSTICEHCGQPISGKHICPTDASNAAVWLGGEKQAVSDKQLHGLYQEDLLEGIRCAECERLSKFKDVFGRPMNSYRSAVLANHGVEPKNS